MMTWKGMPSDLRSTRIRKKQAKGAMTQVWRKVNFHQSHQSLKLITNVGMETGSHQLLVLRGPNTVKIMRRWCLAIQRICRLLRQWVTNHNIINNSSSTSSNISSNKIIRNSSTSSNSCNNYRHQTWCFSNSRHTLSQLPCKECLKPKQANNPSSLKPKQVNNPSS